MPKDFTCCHKTYNHSRSWSVQPGEPPLVMQNHAHSGARPLILAEPPNLMGFTRFAITACSHKLHSWGAAVCGYWPSPKVTNWCSLHPCSSHTSTTMKVRSYAPSNPATRRDTPHVHVLAQEARRKTMDFFPQNLLYLSGDFHTLDRFLRELSFFK